MAQNKTDIYVYAHWKGMPEAKIIGILSAQQAKGKKAFSFEYDKDWLKSGQKFLLDPGIQLYGGSQYSNQKEKYLVPIFREKLKLLVKMLPALKLVMKYMVI